MQARKSLTTSRTLPVQKLLPAARNRCLGPALYALLRICYVEYINGMESVFENIAEPNRRAISSLLVSSQRSVGEIERHATQFASVIKEKRNED